MKIAGIVFLSLAALSFIIFIIAIGQGEQQAAASLINGVFTLGFLGAIFIYFANKKKKEKEDKDKWNKG